MRCGFALLLALRAMSATANDATVKVRVIPELHSERADSPFAVAGDATGLGRDRISAEAELRAAKHDISLVVTARTRYREGSPRDDDAVLNELHYETTLAGQRIGLGKKIFGWDVGFGFRPLDVIQQENRRALVVTTLEGVPYLSWEHFAAHSAWTVVAANPGRGRAEDPVNEESLALKYYLHSNTTDWHGVARLSRRHHWETGAAFSRVVGEGGELHASFLYQRRYLQRINVLTEENAPLLALTDPMQWRAYRHGVKGLLGFAATSANGWALLSEAWYDGSAYSAKAWRTLAALTRSQASLLGNAAVSAQAVRGNIAWSAQAFNQPGLVRENVFIRLSHRGESGVIDPAVDLLVTPRDAGWVLTASVSQEGNRYRVDAGYRWFGGPPDAAYRLFPEKQLAFVAVQVSF